MENIISGFRKTGCPFSTTVFSDVDFAPAFVNNRPAADTIIDIIENEASGKVLSSPLTPEAVRPYPKSFRKVINDIACS